MSHLWQPGAGSANVEGFDLLFGALTGLAVLIVLLVGGLILTFSIRYRQGSSAPRHQVPEIQSREIEIGWTAVTAFIALFAFWWAASSQVSDFEPPRDALEIHIEAKQWMWKAQHPNGAREINEVHVPSGQPVVLRMSSQDVIHSFFVPAFRLKRDVVPGRIATMWFEPTTPGEYLLECAEYCGTDHARMVGRVVVMEPEAYAAWAEAQPQADSLASEGAALFVTAGCSGCHAASSGVHAPSLDGIWGRDVPLEGGRFARVDGAYVRDSILQPRRDIAAGYDPIMPSFAGVLTEGDIAALTAFIREMGAGPPPSDELLRSPAMDVHSLEDRP